MYTYILVALMDQHNLEPYALMDLESYALMDQHYLESYAPTDHATLSGVLCTV